MPIIMCHIKVVKMKSINKRLNNNNHMSKYRMYMYINLVI